jgi:hypothetical protein
MKNMQLTSCHMAVACSLTARCLAATNRRPQNRQHACKTCSFPPTNCPPASNHPALPAEHAKHAANELPHGSCLLTDYTLPSSQQALPTKHALIAILAFMSGNSLVFGLSRPGLKS